MRSPTSIAARSTPNIARPRRRSGPPTGTTATSTAPRSHAASTSSSWLPSKFLTQNEIDAANLVQVNELNVQNQQQITWPAQLTVAQAYVDQLERSQALSAGQISSLRKQITRTQKSNLGAKDLAKLQKMSASVEKQASAEKNPADAKRLQALAQILNHPIA